MSEKPKPGVVRGIAPLKLRVGHTLLEPFEGTIGDVDLTKLHVTELAVRFGKHGELMIDLTCYLDGLELEAEEAVITLEKRLLADEVPHAFGSHVPRS